ncbi:MAG: PAM68 family protein [Cyanobacteriota bacterium]|nr:PAM68 family protein [Cyanobacteriota bacterium]
MPDRKRGSANSKAKSNGAKGSGAQSSPGKGLANPGPAAVRKASRVAASAPPAKPARQRTQQAIPEAVANRMARRIAIATGVPTLLGMGVFIGSYLLVSRHVLDIPPSATLLASGGCFLLGLLGLSYGVLSASWEATAGSLLGTEQIPLNISRIKTSLRALREGAQGQGNSPS